MKVKGVNAFEQHLEQIVLVVVAAVFLIVLALQFLWEHNKVKVGGKDLPPGQAFAAAEEKAKAIKTRIEQREPPQLEEARAQIEKMKLNLVDEFKTRMGANLAPGTPVVNLGPRTAMDITGAERGGAEPGLNRAIVELKVPAPASVVAAPYRATISPAEPLSIPELKPLLPAEQPMDKAWVSVEARFDGAALKNALLADPGKDAKERSIPVQWWRDITAILDVKVESQVQGPEGAWGPPVQVKRIPGRADLTTALKNVQNPVDMEEFVSQAHAYADDVLRPVFYQTIAGPEWMPPSVAAVSESGAPPDVQKDLRSLSDLGRDKANLERRIEAEKQKQQNPGVRQPPGGGGGGKGSGGGQGPTREPRQPSPTASDPVARLEDQLKKLEESIQKLIDSLAARGWGEDGKKIKVAAPVNAADAGKPLLDNTDIQVWAHDLAVEPGKTYRYRVSVAINNPAFGRATALVAEQQSMAASPLVYGQPSEWSAPVTVPADQYYFVTSASEADQVGPAHATVELYKFFYGYYRRGATTVEPGDSFRVASLKLPDANQLPIYDLTAAQPEGGSPAGPGAPSPATQTPMPGRTPAPSDYERDQRPGKGAQPTANEPRGRGQTPVTPEAPGKPELPPNSKPWTTPISAGVDVILLDVARSPGESEAAKPDAIVRVTGGGIEVCDPDDHRSNDLYKRLKQSSDEGETQGAGKPAAVEPKGPTGPTGPVAPTGRERPPRTPPGGGGGAGGG